MEIAVTQQEAELITQLEKAYTYLKDTDWAAMKLAEAQAGIITEDIKTKYADIFIARAKARYQINQLEG